MTPSARLRASHIVLAGNIHLGAPLRRLSETLLPVWRYAAVTAPLGERLAEVITFQGSVTDSDGVDHFRIVDGDRLMWASPETTWAARPQRFAGAIARRIRTIFPQLGKVEIAEILGGAVGQTVHGMPQIGQLRKGLWVASGFGRQGLNTSAMAGQLIARSILWGDERWRLFSPFELVWAGGPTGRVAGHVVGMWGRGSSAAAGALARYRERARAQERIREARLAEANRQAGTAASRRRRSPPRRPPPAARVRQRPAPPPTGRIARRSGRNGANQALRTLASRRAAMSAAASRKKVRKFGPNRCNFLPLAAVSAGEPTDFASRHGDHHDRPPYSARIRRRPVWLCRLPLAARHAGAGRREIRGRKDRRRMARAADAAAI